MQYHIVEYKYLETSEGDREYYPVPLLYIHERGQDDDGEVDFTFEYVPAGTEDHSLAPVYRDLTIPRRVVEAGVEVVRAYITLSVGAAVANSYDFVTHISHDFATHI